LKNVFSQNRLLLYVVFSLGLHIALLAWCPPPTFTIPPFPVYLVVDLFSGPGTTNAEGGLPGPRQKSEQPDRPPDEQVQSQPHTALEPLPKSVVRHKPAANKQVPAPKQPVVEKAPRDAQKSAEPATLTDGSAPEPIRIESTNAARVSGEDESPAGPQFEGVAEGQPGTSAGSGQGNGAEAGPGGGFGGGGGPASGSPVATPLAYGTNPPPPYPVTARRRGWEGKVLLQVDVSARGDVRNVEIEKSSGYTCLDDAARQAVYRWRFRPALWNGRPMPGRVKVPIHFNLKNAD
jgi:protein TonB